MKTPTSTIQDYLSWIYNLQRDKEPISGSRLAGLLNVSAPTVTVTLQRMVRDGWIEISKQKEITLTTKGLTAAQNVIRRHMLTEWLLVKFLKISLSSTHDEAHKIEHAISPVIENRMAEELGNPKVCPHGNPLPGNELVVKDWLPITALKENDRITIRRIHEIAEDNLELLKYLEEQNILPGTSAQVKENLCFIQTVTLSLDDH
jgi:DtxR family Mn-dependent transcriptional regulator